MHLCSQPWNIKKEEEFFVFTLNIIHNLYFSEFVLNVEKFPSVGVFEGGVWDNWCKGVVCPEGQPSWISCSQSTVPAEVIRNQPDKLFWNVEEYPV